MKAPGNFAHALISSLLSISLLFVTFPCPIFSQEFPTKPITFYVGYEAGGASDITARALAKEAEKLFGVPVVVENKPGGGATVCATLISKKEPDGYTLGFTASGVITNRPHLLKLGYDPLKDFTPIMEYSRYIGGLAVLKESPWKNIRDFIEYAKAHPGMSFGSSGIYGSAHLSTVQFANCFGLKFKHVPFKGGAPANTALLGKHVDFVASGDRSIVYVKKGIMRLLFIYGIDKRDPLYPEVPTLKELGCEDVPPISYLVFGPKGIPEPVLRKVSETLKRAAETPGFQKVLASLDLVYNFKDRAQLEKDLAHEYEKYRIFLHAIGATKE